MRDKQTSIKTEREYLKGNILSIIIKQSVLYSEKKFLSIGVLNTSTNVVTF